MGNGQSKVKRVKKLLKHTFTLCLLESSFVYSKLLRKGFFFQFVLNLFNLLFDMKIKLIPTNLLDIIEQISSLSFLFIYDNRYWSLFK